MFDQQAGGEAEAIPGPALSMADHEDRLVWILGSSRSGSTWLLKMLSSLQGVVPIDDPHLGHHLGVWRPIPLAWSTAEQQPELGLLSEVQRSKPSYFFSDRYRGDWMPSLKRLIGDRFGAQVRDHGGTAERVPLAVVKEPGSQVAEWITAMFPRSRMIFLVRDGRDVVDSWLDAYSSDSWGMEEGMYPLSEDGRIPFIKWQASVWSYRVNAVQTAFDGHPPERRAFVHYEDLRADAPRELARVIGELGVDDFDTAQIARVAEDHAYEKVPAAEKGSGQRIRSATPGGWRERMSAEEVTAMEEIMAPALERLGYAGEDRSRSAAIA